MKDYSEETGDGNRGGATCTAGRRYTGIPCSTWTIIVFSSCMPTLQLRASSEQVANHQFRTTPNILEY